MKSQGGLAYLTAAEMSEADGLAVERGVDVVSLMENAGTKTAELARMMVGGDAEGTKVVVVAGKGNNGGDGLVAARHLHNWGAEVRVNLGQPRGEIGVVPASRLATVEKMGIRVGGPEFGLEGADLVIDALLGYGAKGDPREPLAGMIRRANSSGVPILAVDVPSGLDATTGKAGEPCIVAHTTITFGLPKAGFLRPGARRFVGELFVADISLPMEIYAKYSALGMFSNSSLIRVW